MTIEDVLRFQGLTSDSYSALQVTMYLEKNGDGWHVYNAQSDHQRERFMVRSTFDQFPENTSESLDIDAIKKDASFKYQRELQGDQREIQKERIQIDSISKNSSRAVSTEDNQLNIEGHIPMPVDGLQIMQIGLIGVMVGILFMWI